MGKIDTRQPSGSAAGIEQNKQAYYPNDGDFADVLHGRLLKGEGIAVGAPWANCTPGCALPRVLIVGQICAILPPHAESPPPSPPQRSGS